MKNIPFLFVGMLFGVTMYKSEAISWYRIQEMFLFDSFHMYGIIGVAVVLGALLHIVLKKINFKSIDGSLVTFPDKAPRYTSAIIGGSIFGLGWAITGACPGPIYVLIGAGNYSFFIVLVSALFGTLIYGVLKRYLPH